jgi:hypothetical protein
MMPRAEKKKEVLLFPNKITLLNIGCGYPEMKNSSSRIPWTRWFAPWCFAPSLILPGH